MTLWTLSANFPAMPRRSAAISVSSEFQRPSDNDLVETDHTPGFGSAAKYVASTVREIAVDASVYDNKKSVTIVEIMGRHAGWLLTAASALARKFEHDNPVLIYLPEQTLIRMPLSKSPVTSLENTPNLVVCISEGIHYSTGSFIRRYFQSCRHRYIRQHKMLTGSGKISGEPRKRTSRCQSSFCRT